MGSPFLTYAGILERSTHLTHLYVPNDPMVVGYQFWGQSSINGSYGNPAASGVGGAGPSAMLEVNRGDFFRSATLRRKGLAAIPESRKGTTQAAFDLDDFAVPGGVISPDDQWAYVRVQENRNGVGLLTVPGPLPVLGGIYLVPPARSYGVPVLSFTMQAIAPSATGCAMGLPPNFDEDLTSAAPRPMYLVFPLPVTEFTLRNLDGVKNMLVSFGPDQPMQTLPPNVETQIFSGSTKGFVVACPDAGGCPFSLHGSMARW